MAIANIWCNSHNLVVVKLEHNVLRITTDKNEDHKRVLKGKPWVFRNSWPILQEWNGIPPPLRFYGFYQAPIRVQFWGLPINSKTPQIGLKLGWSLVNFVKQPSSKDLVDLLLSKSELKSELINSLNQVCTLGAKLMALHG